MSAGLASWAVETIVASSALMLVALALRGPVARAMGPQAAYLLWALPALRMVLPPLPADWRAATQAPIAAASETILDYSHPIAASAPAASHGPSLLVIVVVAWGLGALLFVVWQTGAHLAFVRRILVPPATRRRIDGARIDLIESDAASGPVAFGVVRRFVAVPRDFAERFDETERELALAHELGHHARGDLIANWFALFCLAVHWCNPIAWVAYRAFRADQEMANDARVLADRTRIDRHSYACAIVKAAHGGAVLGACHFHTISDLKRRLKMLSTRHSPRVRAFGAVGVATLAVAGLSLTASGTAAAEQVRAVAAKLPAIAPISAIAPVAPPAPPVVPAPAPAPAPARVPSVHKLGRTTVVVIPAPDAPASPASPAAPAPPASPRVLHGEHRVFVMRAGPDGAVYEGRAPLALLPPMPPQVIRGDCAAKPDGGVVTNEVVDGKRRVVICTNRIRTLADSGRMQAMMSHDYALSGLRAGRAAIVRDRNLTDESRAKALEGVDRAIREMETARQGG